MQYLPLKKKEKKIMKQMCNSITKILDLSVRQLFIYVFKRLTELSSWRRHQSYIYYHKTTNIEKKNYFNDYMVLFLF